MLQVDQILWPGREHLHGEQMRSRGDPHRADAGDVLPRRFRDDLPLDAAGVEQEVREHPGRLSVNRSHGREAPGLVLEETLHEIAGALQDADDALRLGVAVYRDDEVEVARDARLPVEADREAPDDRVREA